MRMPVRDIRIRLGERIRALRKEQNMSQETLGLRAKIHRTYIGAVERGEQNVSLVNIEKIARVLDVSLAQLFETFR